MKRTCLLTTAVLAAACCMPAKTRLSPATKIHTLIEKPAAAHAPSRADGDTTVYRPLILQIDDEATIDTLLQKQVIIYHRRDDLLLTSIPKDSLPQVLDLDGVINAETMGNACMQLDVARPFGLVGAVQAGSAPLPRQYDGEGVVAGFSDTGFDAQNIAFSGRIAQIHDYQTTLGIVHSATTPAEVAAWTTDNADEYHATHVANILAGGYKDAPYYGVATGAEIVATTSRLQDVGILSGVEDIIAYGKAAGKPTVINLSLSSFLGPHDGTDLVCRYLGRCAEDAVICISAGNTGHLNTTAYRNLSQGEARVTVNSLRTWVGFDVYGITDMWSDTDAPFEFSVGVYDSDTEQTVYQSEWITGEEALQLTTDTDPEWAMYMQGMIYAEGALSELNGRYNLTVIYDIHTDEVSARGPWSRYYTMLACRACEDGPAPTVYMFADASYSYMGSVKGYPSNVGSRASINDLCTAPGVISVGMANSRNTSPLLDGGDKEWDFPANEVAEYTSYNVLPLIPRLPHLCGPGNTVVSAISGEYVTSHPDIMPNLAAESTVDGRPYYWYATGGTSMSAPFVAGVIALWLQADPTLTRDEILDIACTTARTDFADIDDPRWGAGCIDAMAGMQEVLRRCGIEAPRLEADIHIGPDGRIAATGLDAALAKAYTPTGIRVDTRSALEPGTYIVTHPDLPVPVKVHRRR